MNPKSILAGAMGALIALALLVAPWLRRKQLVAGEVSALRNLGNSKPRVDKSSN
jgi:hypothetical protein